MGGQVVEPIPLPIKGIPRSSRRRQGTPIDPQGALDLGYPDAAKRRNKAIKRFIVKKGITLAPQQ